MDASPTANECPSPAAPFSTADTFERASATIRSLLDDINIFNTPAVRSHLESLPSGPELPSSATSPQLHAVIIALRTRLNDTLDHLNRHKDATLTARKRAARAEGQVAELRRQLTENDSRHQATIRDATSRIEALELAQNEAPDQREEDQMKEKDDHQREALTSVTISAERDHALSRMQAVTEQAESLKRQLSELQATTDRKISTYQKEKDLETERVSQLEEELSHARKCIQDFKDGSEKHESDASRLAEKLQTDAVSLKKDLQWESEQRRRLSARLAETEAQLDTLKSRLRAASAAEDKARVMDEELRILRAKAKDASGTASSMQALIREKNELTRLICALSERGDAQEGLSILRDSAFRETSHDVLAARASVRKIERELEELREAKEVEAIRLVDEMDEAKKRYTDLEAEVQKLSGELDVARKRFHRLEVKSRILQKEKDHFKDALQEIEEMEGIASSGSGSESSFLRKRLETSEKALEQYKETMKGVEKELTESQKEVIRLKAGAISSNGLDNAVFESLRHRVRETEQLATDVATAKAEAEQREKEASAQLLERREQLKQLKLKQSSSRAAIDSPLDFDPSTTKVIHVIENPIALAVQKAQTEPDTQTKNSKKRSRLDSDVVTSPSGKLQLQDVVRELDELKKLNKKLEQDSMVGKRTKEIALKRIEEVRSAVYHLFGWSMKIKGAVFKIESMYAETPHEDLAFGMNEHGTMNLLETQYANRLSEEIDQYVRKMNSYPALLSHITMDNFEKTTAC